MQKIVENAILSYETRIAGFESMIEITYQILENFQTSILDTKQEQKQLNAQLRESLARNNSLRKKDFDHMMQRIISMQDEKEIMIRKLLKCYLDEQKETICVLKDDFINLKTAITNGVVEEVKEFHGNIRDLFMRQHQRKKEITSQLKEHQKQQQEMLTRMNALLAKGKELRIRDVKFMLDAFDVQHRERAAARQKLKKEVRTTLDNFKNERRQRRMNRMKLSQTGGDTLASAPQGFPSVTGSRALSPAAPSLKKSFNEGAAPSLENLIGEGAVPEGARPLGQKVTAMGNISAESKEVSVESEKALHTVPLFPKER